MEELTRRKVMRLATATGVATSGAVALGTTNAQAQQSDQEPQVNEQDLRGLAEEENPPPEGEEGQELGTQEARALRLAFIISDNAVFLLDGRRGAVLQLFRSTLAANRALVSVGTGFYYLTMSPKLPRFAIAKKAGLLGLHQVWIKLGPGKWEKYGKAIQKRLEGNLV
jgi:hypothetical protein